jgi:four helix bundle protein
LEVWRCGIELAKECYLITKTFPKEEVYGLTNQIRRAATSIPANIAEGQGREHTKEFIQHLGIARGSLKELETHLILSREVGIVDEGSISSQLNLCNRIGQMLSRLIQALKKRL